MADLMVINNTNTMEVAQQTDSIVCETVGNNLFMVPRTEEAPWIPMLVSEDQENEEYRIIVSPEENKLQSLLSKAAKDEEDEKAIRVPKELLDRLTEIDELAIFKFTELIKQFSGIDEEIFNSEKLATLLLELSEAYALEFVFLQIGTMTNSELEELLVSNNPVFNLFVN